MRWQRSILWFRNDLRIHDHEALARALEATREVIPVYCLDPRHFGETSFGLPKTGGFRTQFLFESLQNLRKRLQACQSNLIVRWGKPEDIIPELAQQFGAQGVFTHKEVTDEEVQVEEALESRLFKQGINLELYWGSTLYHLHDLPMPVGSLPEVFTQFRKQVEKMAPIRDLFPTPEHIPTPHIAEPGTIEHWDQTGLTPPTKDERGVWDFRGGEVPAFERLNLYFWEQDLLKVYKETRNGLLGADYSSKFSAWLALGCISPRKIYHEIKRYESLRKKNSSTYWLIFELIWRDYFRFVAKKHGNTLFDKAGINQQQSRGKVDWPRFEKWKEGQTGIPFVDANMRELKQTGFMSNRGRQNVASFLVNDLQIDWRMGAEYFESQLIDYDVCSNWGNWNYVAGVGNDPREGRYFNVISQAKRYDPQGEYIRHWVPELSSLPNGLIFEPYEAYANQLRPHGVELGVTYPNPVVRMRRKPVHSR